MCAEPVLLLVLGIGGIFYLIPYWGILRKDFSASQAWIEIRVIPRHTVESLLEPQYCLVAYKQDQLEAKGAQIEVFSWHFDNAYHSREDAEAALERIGAKITGYQPIVNVKSVFGEKQFVASFVSFESKRQIFLWSLISAGLCISALLICGLT